jgi:hypothetical protein
MSKLIILIPIRWKGLLILPLAARINTSIIIKLKHIEYANKKVPTIRVIVLPKKYSSLLDFSRLSANLDDVLRLMLI